MRILLSAMIFLSISAQAQCFKYDASKTKVGWGAYKTPAKAIVMGEFKKFSINAAKNSGTHSEILVGSTFSVDATSVFTKNASRDKKIVKNFFKAMTIKGVVKSIKKKQIVMDLVINDKKVKTIMALKLSGNKLKAVGHIDVFDFMLHKNLKTLNNACKALHEGKTWSDVKITLETEFASC